MVEIQPQNLLKFDNFCSPNPTSTKYDDGTYSNPSSRAARGSRGLMGLEARSPRSESKMSRSSMPLGRVDSRKKHEGRELGGRHRPCRSQQSAPSSRYTTQCRSHPLAPRFPPLQPPRKTLLRNFWRAHRSQAKRAYHG